MSEELNKTSENNKWYFWFLVSFSLLLIVTFVYYLPLRFRFGAMHESEVESGMEMMSGGEENHKEMETMMRGEGEEMAHFQGAGEYREEGDVREGLAVNFFASPVPVTTETVTGFDFWITQKPASTPVLPSELEVEHTKLMHVIGVRNDMNEFFHIHPTISPTAENLLSLNYKFSKPGRYKIWSEVKKDGVNHTFGHPEIIVEGEGPREEGEVSFGRNVMAENYQVALDLNEPVRAGRPTDLYFDIHSLTGEVEVEPYLGADMHLAVIKKDWSELIHTHPESAGAEHGHSSSLPFLKAYAHGGVDDEADHDGAHGRDEEIHFQTTFPTPGLYKVFAQFRPKGIGLPQDESLVAGFWVEVGENIGFRFPVRTGLFLVSVIAIAGLSLGVRKFLKVKID